MGKSKEVLQITLTKRKVPKSKLGKWVYWNIWFTVWEIWRLRFLAWFFGGISNFIYWLAPKSVKEEWDKEFEEIEVHIINELNNEKSK